MSLQILFKKSALVAGAIAVSSIFLFSFKPANAQSASSPQFFLTWSTSGSYIPSSYQGKALPTYGSKITAEFDLVSPQGKPLDLSQQTIYWYLNDNLVGGGVGVQKVTFSPVGEAPSNQDLRVTIPSYNGNYLVHEVRIPMVLPVAVILAPYPNGQFSQNPLTLSAIPYFFNAPNASALSYAWSVNGQTASGAENPQSAVVTLPAGTPSGTPVDLSLSIENSNDSTIGTASENLTYESKL
jgi:hypothetical protein